jgi:hypothetical protein
MSPSDPSLSPTDPALLHACSAMLLDRLSQVVVEALTRISDDMTAEALRCERHERRELLLDAVMLVRESRLDIEARFRRSFHEVFQGRMFPAQALATDSAQQSARELSLVSDDSLTDTLEVGRLAQRAGGALDPEQVLGIRARLAALIERDWFDETRHPASPDAIFEALRMALAELAPRAEVKSALLDAFEPHVSRSLNGVYEAVNDQLRAHHILPRLRPQVQTAADVTRRAGGHDASGRPDAEPALGGHALAEAMRTPAVAGAIGAPSSGSSSGAPGSASQSSAGQMGWSGQAVAQFHEAMAQAQAGRAAGRRQMAQLLSNPAMFETDEGPLAPVGPPLVAALTDLQRDHHSGQVPLTGPDIARHVRAQGTPLDQVTAEIVSLVFDYIYSDRRLPDPIKQQLLRLQVVAVKAALLDRGFFARRQHPLRRLIDCISEWGVDPDQDLAPGGALVEGIAAIIDQVTATFVTDLAVFEQGIAEVMALGQQQAELRAQRLARAEREAALREAKSLAQDEARVELERRLDQEVPAFVKDFLFNSWADVLARARCAPDAAAGAQAWSVGLRAAEYLIWSVLPKQSDEIARLAAVLPGLMRGLNRGLDLLELPADARNSFFDALLRTHTRELEAAKKRSGAGAALRATAVRLQADGTVGFAPDAVQTVRLPAQANASAAWPASGQALVRGQRLDLHDGTVRRTFKLAWISPARKLFILSRHPDETLTFDASRMAEMLQAGTLSMSVEPISVERAIRRAASDETLDTLTGEPTRTALQAA